MSPESTSIEAPVKPFADWKRIRADFPILDQHVNGKPLIYFDNAASSQKPLAVLDAVRRYYLEDHSNVHRGIHELSNRATQAYEDARARVAEFIHARSPEEIVFTRGTTEGINLIAQSWGLDQLKAGDQILLTEMEHHSNIVPWQLIARRTGAELVYAPVTGDEGVVDEDRLAALMQGSVKMFAFTHISNTLGTINPAEKWCAWARERGIATLVDAAQSAGHCPVDVQKIGCDFLAFSGHKICGPTGIGALYARGGWLESLPPYQGGGEMISSVDFHHSEWNDPPHKFEAGTPNMAGAIGMHAALDYLDAIGRDEIFKHDQQLAARAWDGLKEMPGARLFGPNPERGHAGLVSFAFEGAHALDVVTLADQKGLALRGGHHCNQPLMKRLGVEATARASFYFYNNEDEVDRFLEMIKDVRRLLS